MKVARLSASSSPPPLPKTLPAELLKVASLQKIEGVDMHGVLLRVLTDLYVSKPEHGFEAIRQFETLTLGLVERADAETRAIIAQRLASHWATPVLVAEKLVAGGGAAAAHMLAHSTALPRAWLLSSALGPSTQAAVAVASRKDLNDDLVDFLAARPEIEVARTLAANISAPLGPLSLRMLAMRGGSDKLLGEALCARVTDKTLLASLFLHASSVQRAAILVQARRGALATPNASDEASDNEKLIAAELEQALLKRDLVLASAIAARALAAPQTVMREIFSDTGGEPVALLLRTLHVDEHSAARIFMCLDKKIGHDFSRVRSLSRLVADLPQKLARELLLPIIEREPVVRAANHVAANYVAASDVAAAGAPSRPRDAARPAPLRRGGLIFARHQA